MSSGFALAARAEHLQLALRARGARSWLAHACSFYFVLQKIYKFIHDNFCLYFGTAMYVDYLMFLTLIPLKLREFIDLARIIPNDAYFEASIRALAREV